MNLVEIISISILILTVLLVLYAYVGYPALLWVMGRLRGEGPPSAEPPGEWPTVSVSVPAYNEEHQIEELIRSLLAIDYPRELLQILIVSDASSDRTDEIVRSFASEGVELLRMPDRGGKTKAENAAAERLRGDIILNTDASIRIAPDALKPMIAAISQPGVGLASGRDISVGAGEAQGNAGESGYVGYEMAVRDLETRLSGIVGASGCFYAIRADLHRIPLPSALSRDFAAALHTREAGLRAVSVRDAVCYVPRTASLKKEFRRKVRTITRGMETLRYKVALLNPGSFGLFSWMLLSHKVLRWSIPWAGVLSFLALGVLAITRPLAAVLFCAGLFVLLLAAVGWALSERPSVPRVFSIPAYLISGNLAALVAGVRSLNGEEDPLWEPTRREVVKAG